MTEINKGDAFIVFHREKDEAGCVLVEFRKLPPGYPEDSDRETTPEENETAELLFRIRFSSPRVIDNVIGALERAKGKFL